MSPRTFSPAPSPWVNVVLPAPRSPDSTSTSPARNCPASSSPMPRACHRRSARSARSASPSRRSGSVPSLAPRSTRAAARTRPSPAVRSGRPAGPAASPRCTRGRPRHTRPSRRRRHGPGTADSPTPGAGRAHHRRPSYSIAPGRYAVDPGEQSTVGRDRGCRRWKRSRTARWTADPAPAGRRTRGGSPSTISSTCSAVASTTCRSVMCVPGIVRPARSCRAGPR